MERWNYLQKLLGEKFFFTTDFDSFPAKGSQENMGLSRSAPSPQIS